MTPSIQIGNLYQTSVGKCLLVLDISKHDESWKKKILILITGELQPVWIMQEHFYEIIN